MRYTRMSWRAGAIPALWIIAWVGGGCVSRGSKQLVPPETVVGERLFVGTPLTGPTAASPEVTESLLLRVTVRWVALGQMPGPRLAPVDVRARVTVAPGSESPLPASGTLTRDVGFSQGEAAYTFVRDLYEGRLGAFVDITERSGDVVPGATVEFTVMPFNPARRARVVTVGVMPIAATVAGAGPDAVAVAVTLTGPTYTGAAESEAVSMPSQETAIIEPVPVGEGSPFAIAIPFSSPGSRCVAVAAIVSVAPLVGEDDALGRLRDAVKSASADAAVGSGPSATGQDSALQRISVVGLDRPESTRPALLYLAGQCEGRIAEDLALVGGDEAVAAVAEEVREFASAGRPHPLPTRVELRWFMDSAAVRTICAAVASDKAPAEMRSILAIHTGDLSRRPDVLQDLVKQCPDSVTFRNRVLAENLIALEDSAPAVRVRAYDWLAARGQAPQGFDPLADARSRRDALSRALATRGGPP